MCHTLKTAILIVLSSISSISYASVTRDLAYPQQSPSALEVAKQVFFVNHYYAVNNLLIKRKAKTHVTVIANRKAGKKVKTSTLRRFLNNDYKEGEVKSKDIALFHSGKLMGTGMLISDFFDVTRSQKYTVWLPQAQKLRHFDEPDHNDTWGDSEFTFGDIYLRRPEHETHELLGKEAFNDCLNTMKLSAKEKKKKYLKQLHPAQCAHKGKEVYKLKSTTKKKRWWYDERISYIDSKTFADYRTEYFKGGKQVKLIDRDWVSMNLDDPRGLYWRYWYTKNMNNNNESMINIPDGYVSWNSDVEPEFWSDDVLIQMRK